MKGIRADSLFVHSKFTRAAGQVTTGVAVFVDGGPIRVWTRDLPGLQSPNNHHGEPSRGPHPGPCPRHRATRRSHQVGGLPPPREPQPTVPRNLRPPTRHPVLLVAAAVACPKQAGPSRGCGRQQRVRSTCAIRKSTKPKPRRRAGNGSDSARPPIIPWFAPCLPQSHAHGPPPPSGGDRVARLVPCVAPRRSAAAS